MDLDEDDDGPPLLVAADGGNPTDSALAAETGELKIARVPITIITGELDSAEKCMDSVSDYV